MTNEPNTLSVVSSRAGTLDDEQIDEEISFVFSRFVGKAPKYPVKKLAKELCKSESMVYAFRSGENAPSTRDLIKCFDLIGVEFANAITAIVGLNGLHRLEPGQLDVLDVASNLSRNSASTIDKASDGVVNHQEAAALVSEYEATITRLSDAVAVLRPIAASGGSLPAIFTNR